ncbi:unnamed protein product [Soboliphyme baturini]|uniref:Epidermal growth factor receptor substrate 15-like 1 n=1 Tax=Soboliphyme baturini TaxID=241478 RepID=A0A183IS84_9BILA|nr:unnamed protein product [Soboliphyme baturini]
MIKERKELLEENYAMREKIVEYELKVAELGPEAAAAKESEISRLRAEMEHQRVVFNNAESSFKERAQNQQRILEQSQQLLRAQAEQIKRFSKEVAELKFRLGPKTYFRRPNHHRKADHTADQGSDSGSSLLDEFIPGDALAFLKNRFIELDHDLAKMNIMVSRCDHYDEVLGQELTPSQNRPSVSAGQPETGRVSSQNVVTAAEGKSEIEEDVGDVTMIAGPSRPEGFQTTNPPRSPAEPRQKTEDGEVPIKSPPTNTVKPRPSQLIVSDAVAVEPAEYPQETSAKAEVVKKETFAEVDPFIQKYLTLTKRSKELNSKAATEAEDNEDLETADFEAGSVQGGNDFDW